MTPLETERACAETGCHSRIAALRIVWTVLLLLVTAGSLLPATSAPIVALGHLNLSDKFEHFIGYALLAFVPTLHEKWSMVGKLALLVIAIGIALEFGQLLSPGRSFEFADMLSDTSGVLCGIILALPFRWYRTMRARQ